MNAIGDEGSAKKMYAKHKVQSHNKLTSSPWVLSKGKPLGNISTTKTRAFKPLIASALIR